jgi:Holliday junction resolvase
MTNKNYVNGRNFEYRIRDMFIQKGFNVIRSAGSHTPIDLVAFDGYRVFFIQCKQRKINIGELKEFIELSKRYSDNLNYTFCVVSSKREGRQSRILVYMVTPGGNLIDMENDF